MIRHKTLPLNKLFIDAVKERITPHNDRTPHGPEGEGYQRDPYSRIGWIEKREEVNDHLMRPIEVSARRDGTYAIIDGGGRSVLAVQDGRLEIECRVHEGLTREEEAKLFAEFDTETYKLRSIDNFLAMMVAKNKLALTVSGAAEPYKIAMSGKGTLKCVGPLTMIFMSFGNNLQQGVRMLSRVCKISANTWSGYEGNDQWTRPGVIEGKMLLALAMILEVGGSKLNEGALRKVLNSYHVKNLEKDVKDAHGKLKTNAFSLAAAKLIAAKYNKLMTDPEKRLAKVSFDNCAIYENMTEQRTFQSRRREVMAMLDSMDGPFLSAA